VEKAVEDAVDELERQDEMVFLRRITEHSKPATSTT
jgi:hypothetical protein